MAVDFPLGFEFDINLRGFRMVKDNKTQIENFILTNLSTQKTSYFLDESVGVDIIGLENISENKSLASNFLNSQLEYLIDGNYYNGCKVDSVVRTQKGGVWETTLTFTILSFVEFDLKTTIIV